MNSNNSFKHLKSVLERELLKKVIEKRRAIFPNQFSDDKISDEVIHEILESANWAPTHRRTEPWRFHVLKGESLNRLSEFVGKWYEVNTPKESYSELKHKKSMKKPLQCSHVIALCMQRDPNESLPEWEEIAAVSMAVQNMWLTCTTHGVGGYWSSPGNINDAHQILNLEEGERCLGWFYLGVPHEDLEIEGTRSSPIENKVKWYSH